MTIECVHCGARGQMDETKIPPGTTSIKCPRCNLTFSLPTITDATESWQVAQQAEPPDQTAPLKQTEPSAPPVGEPPPVPHPPPLATASPVQTDHSGAATTPRHSSCTLCSRELPEEDMVRFGTSWVCAECKPTYVQMLTQGAQRPDEIRYAGFGIRFGAKFLDGLILWLLGFLISLSIGIVLPKASPSPQVATASSVLSFLLQTFVAAAYSGYFLSRYQATPGKMACGLAVITPEGNDISLMRGVGRHFAEILSSAILCIGYLMVLGDPERRSLHDRICNTRVIYK